ncbi:class I SAM-dependent methyltransferase [Alteromonas sp. ASW11-130]|uniref:class I SAM-dependent methyltransferase n=1 Tax=Alteromonas sp. ASW11-130 TaxID=3015775 RepID=UPI002241E38C|nr:class I SAM-dependent methyltransferase [Alteromonas sp. ASW11-130]MCW8092129.1 class I SAM-dependent methyltransferase [Alteromonas sp. ASW11-130]
MNPIQQALNYDKIAEHWCSDRFNSENGISQHERALNFAPKGGKAIDIGCGSSGRIIDLLLKHGYDVEGLDLSSEMLRLARIRHPDLIFHHADICNWHPFGKYSFISAWDSIWHVPLECQASVISKLLEHLEVNGVIIFTSGAVEEKGDGSNLFLGQELYHAALGIPAILKLLESNNCVCRHLENDDFPDKHLYVVAQKSA